MKVRVLKKLRAEAYRKIYIEEVIEFDNKHWLLHNTTQGLFGTNITRYDNLGLAVRFLRSERIFFIKNTISKLRAQLGRERNKHILPL